MGYRRERSDPDLYANNAARSLPGEYADNMRAVMRVRVERVRKLRSQGFSSEEIYEALGLTYRQQRYALRWEARHAIQG